jgi:hypothetical protein
VISFIRRHQDESCLVLHNISDVEITVPLNSELKFDRVDFSTEDVVLENNQLKIPAYASVVLR